MDKKFEQFIKSAGDINTDFYSYKKDILKKALISKYYIKNKISLLDKIFIKTGNILNQNININIKPSYLMSVGVFLYIIISSLFFKHIDGNNAIAIGKNLYGVNHVVQTDLYICSSNKCDSSNLTGYDTYYHRQTHSLNEANEVKVGYYKDGKKDFYIQYGINGYNIVDKENSISIDKNLLPYFISKYNSSPILLIYAINGTSYEDYGSGNFNGTYTTNIKTAFMPFKYNGKNYGVYYIVGFDKNGSIVGYDIFKSGGEKIGTVIVNNIKIY